MRQRRRMTQFVIAILGLITMVSTVGRAQDLARADRGPRFLRRSAGDVAPVPVDLNATRVLRQRVALTRGDATLAELLGSIHKQTGLKFVYSPDVIPVDRIVHLRADSITVAAALTELLVDLGVDVVFYSAREVGLVRRWDRVVQTGTIVGGVTDTKTGRAIAGVEILLEKSRWRTTTDTAGRYRLGGVDSGSYTLMARRFGYAKLSRQVIVRAQREDTVDLVLEPVAARLDELVATATGQKRRRDIANDVTVINADSVMQTAPIRSVTDLLATRVPGLTSQLTSGAPGDPVRLRLRGLGSVLQNNDPIVIVDGIRVYAEQSADRNLNLASNLRAGSQYATPSPLNYIDPNTIETIEVIKGPSAATLYGQDAANGVIVITTKRGKPGPARWTMSAEHGRTQIEGDYPELLYRWGHFVTSSTPVNCPATNMATVLERNVRRGYFPCQGDSILAFQLLNDPALTVLDRGNRTSLSLGVSGGPQALTYAVTGSYQDELGLVRLPSYESDRYQALLGVAPPDWMRRPQHLKQWGVTSNVTARLGAKADFSLLAMLSRTEQQRSSLENQLGSLMSTFLDRSSGIYYQLSDGVSAPVTTVLNNYFERATDVATQFKNAANLKWKPRTWITLNAAAGLDMVQRSDLVLFPRGPVYFGVQNDTTGHVTTGQGTSVVSTLNLRADASQPIGAGFQFLFSAGANYTGTSTRDVAGSTSKLSAGSSLQGSQIDAVSQLERSDATFSWFMEPSVGNQKFNFSSGLQLAGGSSYGASTGGLKLPKFPKLGFTYTVSDESWFPLKSAIQSLRVRLSYGRASRQPGLKEKFRLYGIPFEGFADSQFVTAITLQALGNTEVRPERTAEFEGGFDADFLDNRINLVLTGYRKTTDDALLGIPVAASVYGSDVSIIKNIGVVRNTGLEMTVGAQWLRSGPVAWGTQLRLSQSRNVLVKLGPNMEPYYDPNLGGAYLGGLRVAPGYPLYGRWSRPILGYADANGNGVLEPQEVQLGDTAVYVGSMLPNYTMALSTTLLLWHGAIAVNADFSYEDGLSQRNEVAQRLGLFSRGQQDPTASLAEQLAMIHLARTGEAGRVELSDYNWIQTVSTTRFQSVSVSYQVPAAVTRRLGAQTLSIAVQGANLGLWTNYRGIDPNVNAFSTGNNVTDTGVLPQPRTWQLRVSATY